MSRQAALQISSERRPHDEGQRRIVDRCFAEMVRAQEEALEALGAKDEARFVERVTRAVGVVSKVRDCLDYGTAPVLAAYLHAMFDYAIAQLIDGRAMLDERPIGRALYVAHELRLAFLAVDRDGDE